MLMKLSYILAAISLVCTMTFAAGCGSKNSDDKQAAPKASFRSIADIKQSGKLIIGVFSDKAPFGYIDKDGNYQGYDVYFAERLAKDLGVKAEYISLEPANRVEYAKTGKVDIVLANFTVTKERAEQVDFALPYMKVALGVVSPAKANITSIDQLKDKLLIVAKGTTAETYFAKHHPEVKLLKFDQYTETFNALLDGRGAAFSTDNTEVLAWAMKNPDFKVGITSLGDLDTIAPAVQKGNKELLAYINDEIKNPTVKYVALSGPTHAEEVSIDMPTTIVSACKDIEIAKIVQCFFSSSFMRVYTNTDIKGIEICGAMKNIIALATGISRGLGYGDNATAALITRGLAELSRLGNAMGCSPDTFSGLTGMGDLIVTCTSLHSRNNNAGFLIGQGLSPDEAVKKVGMVVEGINALPAAIKLGKKYNIDLPIINAVNNVVNGIVSPRVAVNSLLNREPKPEV